MFDYKSKFICNQYDIVKQLQKFGIDFLTGESCGYSMRVLCDVNQAGAELLSDFFGGVALLADNWNPGASKSVMLTRSVLEDLFIFATLQANPGITLVSMEHSEQSGKSYRMFENNISQDDIIAELDYLRGRGWTVCRVYWGKNRNQHMITGRVE